MPTQQTTFPFYQFSGTHRHVGRLFGEACETLIHRHLQLVYERRGEKVGLTREQALEKVLPYRRYVLDYAPQFDEEVRGLAEGSRLTLEEAYLLQLRAELNPHKPKVENECTTFAILPEATSDGVALIGQNADLPTFYGELSVVVEMRFDDAPAVLMLTPAGQISYIGMNDAGLGVFANYLTCDGWREGFPRYMFSRYALQCSSIHEALQAVRDLHRASSRNLIMLDEREAVDFENTPIKDALLHPEIGLIAHANHYLAKELQSEERSRGRALENSRIRQVRMVALLQKHHGKLNAELLQTLLRDRATYPNAICHAPDDDDSGIMTFASVVAAPSKGTMWVAKGPPHLYDYAQYSLS